MAAILLNRVSGEAKLVNVSHTIVNCRIFIQRICAVLLKFSIFIHGYEYTQLKRLVGQGARIARPPVTVLQRTFVAEL
jgi:hypothetical protein